MAFSDGIADFRSDTVTRPTDEMRAAMAAAEVGDDVYGEDPTVNLLEREAADICGKEAGVFVPSGTMGNQLAIGVHTEPGAEIVCVETAHIRNSEVGAPGALWGVNYRTVSSRTGAITPDQVAALAGSTGFYSPRISLLEWENTHNASGGSVTDLDLMRETSATAHAAGWSVHLDGARIFNAAVSSGHGAESFAAVADTVSFCFSKGLGAPVGSILCGNADTIDEARYLRRRLGGGLRQAGVLAAAARIALRDWKRLEADHALADHLAGRLSDVFPTAVEPGQVRTNMALVHSDGLPFSIDRLIETAGQRGIKLAASGPGVVRLVTHRDVDEADADRLLSVMTALASG